MKRASALLACALLALGAAAAVPSQDSRVTVLVENTSTDVLRISGKGTSGARIQPGRRACIRVSAGAGTTQLLATPVGAQHEGGPLGQNAPTGESPATGRDSGGSAGAIRSPQFDPAGAPAWSWRVGTGATGMNDFRPAERPCA